MIELPALLAIATGATAEEGEGTLPVLSAFAVGVTAELERDIDEGMFVAEAEAVELRTSTLGLGTEALAETVELMVSGSPVVRPP